MEYDSTIEKNKILIRAMMWMNLKSVTLSERIQEGYRIALI